MKSLWNDNEATSFGDDPLQLRVYTSRLLGRDPGLVLHGGGNTSVKDSATNIFGETEKIIYVKGSGWDLETIEAAGFAPVKLDVLLQMAALPNLTDSEMVQLQRAAMTDPSAPTPSVEAILHAFIPFAFVDHTHADAVVTITNTKDGERRIRDIYGERVMIVPYVMPGFILAKKVYDMTRDIDWAAIDGMILLNHGVFTFHDDAKTSYERMIDLVSKAEDYLREKRAVVPVDKTPPKEDLVALARIRRAVADRRGAAVIAHLDQRPEAVAFSSRADVSSIATRGPLTPDHVIRTKRTPVLLGEKPEKDATAFASDYEKYFDRHRAPELTCLDNAPRWAVWPRHGLITFGRNQREAEIVSDIKDHTIKAIQQAECLGGWQALPEKDIFDVEYWELEQAKLKKAGTPPILTGKVALVTGAASGIGRACVDALCAQGAAVAALDIDDEVTKLGSNTLGVICNITDEGAVKKAIDTVVRRFGGLDIVISNAGVFPKSQPLKELPLEEWNRSLSINLTGHQLILKACIPYLEVGIDPAVAIIASKNVPAPGRGAAAYSVAKAGLTQLARVAALELGASGIRVNVVHPNNVFDTGIWSDAVIEARAKNYGMTSEEYRKSSVLGVEVSSADVAALACNLVGPAFAKTTGAQIPIDGGNDRVI